MEIHTSTSSEQCLRQAQQALVQLCETSKRPVLLLCSGGSALELLTPSLIPLVHTWGVLDERLSSDPQINNTAQLLTRLNLTKTQAQYIDLRVEHKQSLEQLSQQFDTALRTWVGRYPHGTVIVTMGMGTDGHTAGIFPNTTDFFKLFASEKFVVGYTAPKALACAERITVTNTFLTKIVSSGVLYCVGESKKPAVQRLLASSGTCEQTPARVVQDMKQVTLYTDQIFETISYS